MQFSSFRFGKILHGVLLLAAIAAGMQPIVATANSTVPKPPSLTPPQPEEPPEEARQSARFWIERGDRQLQDGDYAGAILSYNRALALEPDNATVWSDRGDALLRSGQYLEAISSYDRAIELQPDYAKAFGNRGAARIAEGDIPAAIADLQQAADLFAIQNKPRLQQKMLEAIARLQGSN